VNQGGVAAQPEPGHQEAEVILAGDQVGRRCDVDEYVYLTSADAGIAESRACRRQRQVAIVDATIGPAALAPPPVEVMGGRAVDSTEERARAFAAQLLLPKEQAGRALASTTDPAQTVRSLSARYGVSQEIVARQARNSGIQLSAQVHAVLRRFVSRPWMF
jgi:hypothetical protein